MTETAPKLSLETFAGFRFLVTSSDAMKNLGELLVNLHLLTPEQLETAELLQSIEDGSKSLEEVLIEQGMIDQPSLAHALEITSAISEGKVVRKAPGTGRADPTPAAGANSRQPEESRAADADSTARHRRQQIRLRLERPHRKRCRPSTTSYST
jgi:hypothetical protein